MRGVFEVVRRVRDWLRSVIPDTQVRLMQGWVWIIMSLIYLKQERIAATRQEILRATSLSSSSVHRGLGFLTELGIIKENDKVYDFAIEVPRDILDISAGDGNVTQSAIEDLKRFIVAEVASAGLPHEQVQAFEQTVTEYVPKPVAERKGTKKRLGDALV